MYMRNINKSKAAMVAGLTALALSPATFAAIDVTEAVGELDGMLIPIGLLGAAALVVSVVIKVWKRLRGAA
jgi:hypothetical protein